MIRPSKRRGVLLCGILLGLVASPYAVCADQPPADEALRVKALEQGKAKLAKSLDRALAHISAAADGGVVGLLRVKPALAADLDSPVSGLLDALLLRTLLSHGVLVREIEADGAMAPVYKGGKLSKKSRVTTEHRTRIRDQLGVGFSLEAHWAHAEGRYDVQFRLRELQRGRTLRKWGLSRIDAREVPPGEIVSIRPLPEENVAILLYAIRMLGKRVDGGECWDVPAHPLKARGFTPNGYNFGRKTTFDASVPGDVVTIHARGHQHVMVLWQKRASLGESTILHQKWNGKRHVIVMRYPGQLIRDSILWRPGP